jgi:hypothetical protein
VIVPRIIPILIVALMVPPWLEASSPKLYLHGLGALRIGMSLSAVRHAIGDRTASLEGNDGSPDICSYLRSRALPKGVGLMFMHGRVVRIDIRDGDIRTASGIGIGSTEDDVKRVYGKRITSEPHKYIDGHYLVYTPIDEPDRELAMRFETDGRVVINYRTGRADAVQLVEGCA